MKIIHKRTHENVLLNVQLSRPKCAIQRTKHRVIGNVKRWLIGRYIFQAKELLSIDGAIFISCDNAELAYLQVLCEEIFHESNFVTNIIWKKGKEGGKNLIKLELWPIYLLLTTIFFTSIFYCAFMVDMV